MNPGYNEPLGSRAQKGSLYTIYCRFSYTQLTSSSESPAVFRAALDIYPFKHFPSLKDMLVHNEEGCFNENMLFRISDIVTFHSSVLHVAGNTDNNHCYCGVSTFTKETSVLGQ